MNIIELVVNIKFVTNTKFWIYGGVCVCVITWCLREGLTQGLALSRVWENFMRDLVTRILSNLLQKNINSLGLDISKQN